MNRDLIDDTPALQTQYESLVVTYIREKYSMNEELAILRKHIEGIDIKAPTNFICSIFILCF